MTRPVLTFPAIRRQCGNDDAILDTGIRNPRFVQDHPVINIVVRGLLEQERERRREVGRDIRSNSDVNLVSKRDNYNRLVSFITQSFRVNR